MMRRTLFTGLLGLSAVALLAAGCRDSVSPRTAAFDTAPTSGVELSGNGQVGPGVPTPGSDLQTFTFDVKSNMTGTLRYTDYSIPHADGTPTTLHIDPAAFPATGITGFRTTSTACADPTKGAEFDGHSEVEGEPGVFVDITVAGCDNGPPGSGLDFFRIDAPSFAYTRSGNLTAGDIVKSSTDGTSTGNLTVTTSTTGSDLDPDGYTVTVSGAAGTASEAIATNGSVTFSGAHAGDYSVSLTGVAANCTVSAPNPRTVSVTAGSTGTASFSVTCTTPNSPPTVNAGSDETVLLGILYTESATFSDPNDEGPWWYTINWGDGSSTSGTKSSTGTISPTHTYLLGSYTIRATVTDSHGASGSDSKVLTVITNLPGLP
jgi:hypothetical protein